MLLKSLKLKNFRQYKGVQQLHFAADKDKNVTVILGDNTSGKTTLVQAFIWAFYGKESFNSKELLNKDIELKMRPGDSEPVEVQICLVHDDTEYTITRSQLYVCSQSGIRGLTPKLTVSYKQKEDGQEIPIRDSVVNSTINKILPEDLSNYFFFDGERINNISSKRDVAKAVQGLLGLSVLDNTMKHLDPNRKNSVIGKLNSSLDVGGNKKALEAQKNIEKAKSRREEIQRELKNVKNQIDYFEMRKKALEETLLEIESTAKLQSRANMLNKNIEEEQKALDEAKESLIKDFNTNYVGFFASPIIKKAEGLLREMDIKDRGIPNMNSLAIDFLIERGKCVCGEKIVEGSAVHAHLLKEKEFLPPQSIGTMIRNFLQQSNLYTNSSSNYFRNIKSRYEEMRRCKSRIQEWSDELEEIRDQIEGKEDAQKYEMELRDVKKRLKEWNNKRDALVSEDGACKYTIETNQKIYDRYAIVSDKNKEIKQYLVYANAIYEKIKDFYEEKEQEIKDLLEEKVNKIFSLMYHGHRKVIIDNVYRVNLLTLYEDQGVETDESGGLETVKNFAFIAGLVELAREKIISKNNEEMESAIGTEAYPLVMDAPFSKADEKHVSNIAKVLPEVAEQIIMVVMEKDWGFAKNVMNDKVGKQYLLEKKSETLTLIKEC